MSMQTKGGPLTGTKCINAQTPWVSRKILRILQDSPSPTPRAVSWTTLPDSLLFFLNPTRPLPFCRLQPSTSICHPICSPALSSHTLSHTPTPFSCTELPYHIPSRPVPSSYTELPFPSPSRSILFWQSHPQPRRPTQFPICFFFASSAASFAILSCHRWNELFADSEDLDPRADRGCGIRVTCPFWPSPLSAEGA